MEGMEAYPRAAVERAMKVQEVMLRAMARKMVARGRKRGGHRKRRPRRPLPGMLLHIDGSRHQWFQDERWHDLLVILDDATSEIYYAQLVEEESTATVMAGLREVIERQGLFCALYSDRGSPFWLTPPAGGEGGFPSGGAGGAGAARVGDSDDPRLFAAGAGPFGAQLRDLAGTTAAGAAAARGHHGGRSQSLFRRALHPRVQSALSGGGGAAGHGLHSLPTARPGADLLAAL